MVNRMFDSYLKEKWIQSLQYYVKNHLYGNVTLSDLTNALLANGVPEEDVHNFENWLMYSGYPIIKISISDGKALIEQTPSSYFLNNTQLWSIHMNLQVF